MHAPDAAPGQTPGQPDAPANEARIRADKTRRPPGQFPAGTTQGGAGLKMQTGGRSDLDARSAQRGGAGGTRSRPSLGGKKRKTKPKAGAKRHVARKGLKSGKATGVKGRAKAKPGPKPAARKATSKTPTKTRAGSGKAGGKRNR